MKNLIYTILLTLTIWSCGTRKVETIKQQEEVKTEQQATSLKEAAQVISEESQTDYIANDPGKPIIEISGKDTVKIYNANKTVRTKKTTAKRQTDAQTTIDTTKQEKAQ